MFFMFKIIVKYMYQKKQKVQGYFIFIYKVFNNLINDNY